MSIPLRKLHWRDVKHTACIHHADVNQREQKQQALKPPSEWGFITAWCLHFSAVGSSTLTKAEINPAEFVTAAPTHYGTYYFCYVWCVKASMNPSLTGELVLRLHNLDTQMQWRNLWMVWQCVPAQLLCHIVFTDLPRHLRPRDVCVCLCSVLIHRSSIDVLLLNPPKLLFK